MEPGVNTAKAQTEKTPTLFGVIYFLGEWGPGGCGDLRSDCTRWSWACQGLQTEGQGGGVAWSTWGSQGQRSRLRRLEVRGDVHRHGGGRAGTVPPGLWASVLPQGCPEHRACSEPASTRYTFLLGVWGLGVFLRPQPGMLRVCSGIEPGGLRQPYGMPGLKPGRVHIKPALSAGLCLQPLLYMQCSLSPGRVPAGCAQGTSPSTYCSMCTQPCLPQIVWPSATTTTHTHAHTRMHMRPHIHKCMHTHVHAHTLLEPGLPESVLYRMTRDLGTPSSSFDTQCSFQSLPSVTVKLGLEDTQEVNTPLIEDVAQPHHLLTQGRSFRPAQQQGGQGQGECGEKREGEHRVTEGRGVRGTGRALPDPSLSESPW